ncbi:type IV pilin protein [Cupriavidus sp. D39]|uniref:type IV pilin protein n=1 Tax=Cupriavidus sp. D39 TaxID=2997877 RepID=UPI00226F7C5B|nr:type IV pilin protein [Cupriavidus sp. D39]MCY0854932.1 prepilin-type N-terminal cleavage/methylation domain-containing protein [Cupriavidus sp. D39]
MTELLITVVIVGILAAIAYPSYTQYVIRSNRSAAESFILAVASQQEQYSLDARQYATTMATLGYATLPTEVAKNYTVTVTANNVAVPPSYTVTATPIGAQAASDTKCQNLTVNQAGTKGMSGTGSVADCW